jgi:hypothetical protein
MIALALLGAWASAGDVGGAYTAAGVDLRLADAWTAGVAVQTRALAPPATLASAFTDLSLGFDAAEGLELGLKARVGSFAQDGGREARLRVDLDVQHVIAIGRVQLAVRERLQHRVDADGDTVTHLRLRHRARVKVKGPVDPVASAEAYLRLGDGPARIDTLRADLGARVKAGAWDVDVAYRLDVPVGSEDPREHVLTVELTRGVDLRRGRR